MAFLSSSPGAKPELAGSQTDPALTVSLLQLAYDIDWGQITSAASDVSDLSEIATSFIIAGANRIVEAAWLRNSIMLLTPISLPAVDLPFQVRQAPAQKIDGACCPCIIKPRYFLVLFNTHTAAFAVRHCGSKQEMMDSYDTAFRAVLQADARFREADAKLVGQNTHNMADFHRVPAGIFRHSRLVQITNQIVSFGRLESHGAVGVIGQMLGNKAQSLDGKTGSWERLLEVAKIRHKKGPQQGLIASGIADFIGLWACATGDVASLGGANKGAISPGAPLVSSKTVFLQCLSGSCWDAGSPESNTRVKYRFDAMSAWH